MPLRLSLSVALFSLVVACGCTGSTTGKSSDGGTGQPMDASQSDAGSAPATVADLARMDAAKLRPGSTPHFLIGLVKDDTGAGYNLGVTLDLRYAYLTGFSDAGGWPTWNTSPQPTYDEIVAMDASSHGSTPMFTYYAMALEYEQGRDSLNDAAKMDVYMNDVKLLFTDLASLDAPAVVDFEPDLMGYLQQRLTAISQTPDTYPAALHTTNFHDCDDLPQTAHGWVSCLIRMARTIAPKVLVGFHASQWADWYDPTDPNAPVETKARSHADFLNAIGANQADMIVVETLDRDAGYWETHVVNSMGQEVPSGTCSATNTGRGYPVYWDETNTTVPNFHQHFRWVSALTTEMGLPALWWQLPMGVPSNTCGGSDGHYRDNRVHYFFSHVDELIAAGGFGAVWGPGADLQTYIDTDNGQFHDAVNAYFAAPVALP